MKDKPQTPEEIEANLKAITDSHKLTDRLQSGKLVMVFQCNGTGLYFPPDYIKMWGRFYGHGLGKAVVSECLETKWEAPLAVPKSLRHPSQIMYGVGQGGHQVSAIMMKPEEMKSVEGAVLMIDDPFIDKRGKIMRIIQMDNPNGKLKALTAVMIANKGDNDESSNARNLFGSRE